MHSSGIRSRTLLIALSGATLVAVAVAGCTSGAGSSKAATAKGLSYGLPVQRSVAAHAPNFAAETTTGTSDGIVASQPVSRSTLISDTRSVIRRAELTVGVKTAAEVATQANQAEDLVTKLGGDVFGDDRESGTDSTATLTLKVPPASLITALNRLSKLGTERSRALSSQDVTTQVADVDARVRSAESSIARLRTLFASATKVGDVIAIEEELSGREADLESLQAQQKTLATETQLATITLVLTTGKAPMAVKPKHHDSNAFVKGWHHFVDGGSWLITVLVSVVPFLVIALLIGFGALRARRRRIVPEPEPAAA